MKKCLRCKRRQRFGSNLYCGRCTEQAHLVRRLAEEDREVNPITWWKDDPRMQWPTREQVKAAIEELEEKWGLDQT